MPTHNETETMFDHSSAPHSVKPQGRRGKYRDNEDYQPLPVSSDPRVVRGSTTVLARKVANQRKTIKAKTMSKSMEDYDIQLPRATYQYNVQGHVGPDVDLSSYLIAAEDGISRQMKEKNDQTDAFKDRPDSPAYVPHKTGIDNTTQVEDVRDLFDFDAESQPIVDVIVSKTLEQAIFEVRHEEELLALEEVERSFADEKVKERQWIKQKEDETMVEYRAHINSVRRQTKLKEEERRLKRTVAGMQAMKQVLPGVFDNAVEDLFNSNTWRRPERAEVEDMVMKQAMDSQRSQYKIHGEAKKMVDEILAKASESYEACTHVVKHPVDGRCVVLKLNGKSIEGEGDETSKPKKMDPVRIWGPVSVVDVYRTLKQECADKDYTTDVTMQQVMALFRDMVGRDIAKDGALIRFSKYLPDEIHMDV